MKSALSTGATPPCGGLYDTLAAAGTACAPGFIAHFCPADSSATGDFNQRVQSLVARGIHDICGRPAGATPPPFQRVRWKRRSTAVTHTSFVISATGKSNLFQDAPPICNSAVAVRHFRANCRANDSTDHSALCAIAEYLETANVFSGQSYFIFTYCTSSNQ